MNAVALLLGLLGGSGLAVAQESGLPPAPAPVLPVAAPAPLPPQLQVTGGPPLADLTLPGESPRPGTAPAPLALQPQPAPPPREAAPPASKPPPFRILVPARGSDPGPPAPPPAPPQNLIMAGGPGAAQTPSLVVEKHGPATVHAGQPFTYEIVLRNVGLVPALGIRLEDELPAGTRFVGSQPPTTPQGDRLVWTGTRLPPAGEQRFRVEVIPAGGAEWNGKATVTVSVAQALRVAVSGGGLTLNLTGPPTVVVGHPVPFDLRLTNSGSTPLTNLTLRVPLPPGLQHPLGSAIEAADLTLAPGETRTLNLELIAAQPGRQSVEAAVLSGKQTLTTTRAEVLVTEDPVLTIRITGPAESWVNQESEYRLEVTNRSGVAARSVTVTDLLPVGVAFVGSGATWQDATTRIVRWQVGAMEPGQTKVISLKLMSRVEGGVLNQASARNEQGHEAQLHSVLRFRATPVGGNGRR